MKSIECLIEENKKLIYSIAYKYSKYYNIEDLYQMGVIGLMKAYKNYNICSNAKFTTYAHKYIYGEILEYIKKDRNVKIDRNTYNIYKAYEKSKDFLTNELNRIPTFEEIRKFMNINGELLIDSISKCEFTISLDNEINEEDFSLDKVIGQDNRDNIDSIIDLKLELDNLDPMDRKLIILRYFNDFTQSETAKEMGLSQVQVSRYESQILKKMKRTLTV